MMKNLWIVLASLSFFSYGMQACAGDEPKDSARPEGVRAASSTAKTKPRIKAEPKAKTRNRDTAKMPVDPLERGADKQLGKENVKNEMPPDPLEKSMQTK